MNINARPVTERYFGSDPFVCCRYRERGALIPKGRQRARQATQRGNDSIVLRNRLPGDPRGAHKLIAE